MIVRRSQPGGERGYVLLSILLFMVLMLIALSIELPRITQQIRREKEQELINRGNEYKSAIRKYFRKFARYPATLDQLENTNNMRFLRKRYKDPFTGKDDWRLLHPGEVQVNLATGGTNTFGQPSGQIGSSIGQPSNQTAGVFAQQPGGVFGQPAAPGGGIGQPSGQFGSSIGQPGSQIGGTIGSSSIQPGGAVGTNPQAGTDPNASGTVPGTSANGITPASNLPGASSGSPLIGGGPIIGVSSTSKLQSIKIRDGKDHYNDWPFWYDPLHDQQTIGGVNPGQMGINPTGASPVQGQAPTQNPTVNAPGTINSPGMGQPRVQN